MTQSDPCMRNRPLDRAAVLAKVYEVVAAHLGREDQMAGWTEATDLWDDLECDDLDEIEVILIFEETFGVEIVDGEIGNWRDDNGVNQSSLGHCADVIMKAAAR